MDLGRAGFVRLRHSFSLGRRMTCSGRPGPRRWGPGADRLLWGFIPGACVFLMGIVTQSFCNLPISVRGRRVIEFCVQRQHSAMFVAVIAPPDIFDEIDIHPPAAVAAERAVHIDAVCLLAPDPQVQQFHNFHDTEGKFIRVRAHLSFLPSCPRRGPYQPAF